MERFERYLGGKIKTHGDWILVREGKMSTRFLATGTGWMVAPGTERAHESRVLGEDDEFRVGSVVSVGQPGRDI